MKRVQFDLHVYHLIFWVVMTTVVLGVFAGLSFYQAKVIQDQREAIEYLLHRQEQ